ncbi:FecCD family ABC transporter permease [Acidisarcina polymorpha]|uniref:FecCD family ABC transporter permease n=1 Tax=Acidisarcina polymorpha TaxID=2211140 RepID=UPI001374A651|nr:iron ABC transporter permease [Acidisarcina polymorpha]
MSSYTRLVLTLIGFVLLILLCLSVGARPIGLDGLIHGIFHFNGSANDVVVIYLRFPRVLQGLLVGAALGVGGAVIQGLTRNPLADPAVLGINGGASLALVITSTCFHGTSLAWRCPIAFVGSATALLMVYSMSTLLSAGGLSSLVILGAVVAGLTASLTTTLLLSTGHDVTNIMYWLVGSLNGSDWPNVLMVLPLILAGLALSLTLAGRLNALRLGEDVAQALGVDMTRTRAWGTLAILLLTAAAVASTGPIGFVGLLVAHIVRSVVGLDYRKVLPGSAIAGSSFLLLCDFLARTRLWVSYDEVPVGLVTACFGAPLLLFLLQRRRVYAT